MKQEDLIIDRPEWVSKGQRLSALGVTLFFWFALLYLWQPAISLLAWAFNIKLFYSHMVVLGGYEIFLDTWLRYLLVILLLGGSLILWAKINEWRFRGVDRRKGISQTEDLAICQTFAITEEDLKQWRTMKNIVLTIDERSQVESVNIHTASTKPSINDE